jgi:peptidoglycan/LPS O-acetylase OafA/YrhL
MKVDNKYISYLDGLRGYAILFVLLGHFELTKIYLSRFGVTVFFFVSGFLITKLLIYEYKKQGSIHLKDFYLRRVFRLYPALIFMLLSVLLILFIHNFKVLVPDTMAGLFYFTNYYLVYFKPLHLPENYLLVSNILWSLSVEEHFYLVFPLLFAVCFRVGGKRFTYGLIITLLLFLLVRVYSVIGLSPARAFAVTYFPTHTRGDSILYGCVSALLIYSHQTGWYLRLLQSKWVFWLAVALLGVSLVYRQAYFQNTFAYSLIGIGFFFVIPSFSFVHATGIVKSIIDNKVTVYIGKLSYSLYLFHWVALKMGNLYFDEKNVQWYLFVIPMTTALACLSYYVVERPFLALRKKYGSNVSVKNVVVKQDQEPQQILEYQK